MVYAEITDNLVTNVAVCEDEVFATRMGWVLLADGFGIGDLCVNGEFQHK